MSYARMATFGNSNYVKKLLHFTCEKCAFSACNKNDYTRHIKTIKHIGYDKPAKKLLQYTCEKCAFSASNKNDYNRHLKTIKHVGYATGVKYVCNGCEREYANNSGLWRHKQKCITNSVVQQPIEEVCEKDELIMTLLKQNTEQNRMNAELHAKVIELCKIGTINNINSNNNNNNTHKTFNLQFFLNETCKDAVNLEDFAKAVVLQLSDIDKIGEVGYVDGMANIIETKLKTLDIHRRPIHCTDVKREVFYVKDNDKWAKDENKKKMRALIQRMDRKLAPLLITFNNNHANRGYSSDSEHNKHQQMVIEIVGGKNDDEQNEDAIIRSISKKTLIEKCE